MFWGSNNKQIAPSWSCLRTIVFSHDYHLNSFILTEDSVGIIAGVNGMSSSIGNLAGACSAMLSPPLAAPLLPRLQNACPGLGLLCIAPEDGPASDCPGGVLIQNVHACTPIRNVLQPYACHTLSYMRMIRWKFRYSQNVLYLFNSFPNVNYCNSPYSASIHAVAGKLRCSWLFLQWIEIAF